MPRQVRTGGMVVASDLGSEEPPELLFSQLSARAIEAVCLLMVDSFDLETLMSASHDAASLACTTVPFAMLARMDEAAGLPD